MKKQSFIVGAILIITALAATLLFNMYQKSVQEAKALEEQKKALEERKTVERLIGANDKFAICKIYNLKFLRLKQCMGNNGTTICNFPQHRGACLGGSFCNLSDISDAAPLRLLAQLKYVDLVENPGQNWMWSPDPNLKDALGKDLEEHSARNGTIEGTPLPYLSGLGSPLEWTLNLGCREFVQVDAMTPLADGVKADFSWRWKVNDMGRADGMPDARQRGVAYFRNQSGGGLDIDDIKFGEE